MSNFIEAWGYCGDHYTEFFRCAPDPSYCNIREWEDFNPTPYDKRGSRCDPNDMKMGRCLKENTCALRPSDCELDSDDSNFDEKDEFCTYLRDTSLAWNVDEDPMYTQFGSCKNTETGEYFCIYNPSDCDESGVELYATPSETLEAGFVCDCSEVHVTACEGEGVDNMGEIICATTKESCNRKCPVCDNCSCDPTSKPFSPHEQREGREKGEASLDCRLCQRREILSPIPAPVVPKSSPSVMEVNSEASSARILGVRNGVIPLMLLGTLWLW